MNPIRQKAHEIRHEVIAFRHDLHMYPELSMQEFRTSDQVAAMLDALGIPNRRIDPVGVVGEISGGKPGKCVALRADMDALQITETADCDFKSRNEGKMHACGHDAHTAMLMGAAMVLNDMKDEIAGSVRLLFQPGEENGQGAKAIIAQGGYDGVDAAFGQHILPAAPVGRIGAANGTAYAACDYFRVTVRGVTCHGSMPHDGRDATVCASAIVLALQSMVSREFDQMEPLVVSVGTMHSGTIWNGISGEAVMEGTCRSFSKELHAKLPEVFKRVCQRTAEAYGCEVDVHWEIRAQVLVNDDAMRELGFAAARKVLGGDGIIGTDRATPGAEDFAEYGMLSPVCYFSLGTGGTAPIHNAGMVIDEDALEIGVAFLAQTALDALEKLNG